MYTSIERWLRAQSFCSSLQAKPETSKRSGARALPVLAVMPIAAGRVASWRFRGGAATLTRRDLRTSLPARRLSTAVLARFVPAHAT
jgi:hypothetical protein